MNTSIDISLLTLLGYLGLFIIPFFIFQYLNLGLSKQLLISIIRMVVQLLLVAIYLETIFELNLPWINGSWILIMVITANITIVRQSGFQFYPMVIYTIPALLFSIVFMLISFLLVLDFNTLSSARYAVPLGGMILGNLLRGNIVALNRFYTEVKRREQEYMQWVSMGASLFEAVKPFFKDAVKAAMAPQLGTMATMGLVSLPGMMTGQILGGTSPGIAVKYQIMIMTAIYVATSISVFLTVRFSMFYMFDSFNRINRKNLRGV